MEIVFESWEKRMVMDLVFTNLLMLHTSMNYNIVVESYQ